MPQDALLIENLGKTYRLGVRARQVHALLGLDLRVEEGAIYGFVGPNGAGKSTTIKILVGLVRPTTGTAHILGKPISHPAARKAVGYLPENPSFPDFLRPMEVMRFLGKLSGLSGADLDRQAAALLERVGLSHALDLTTRKFSKGMVQRLGLAQALLHDPPLLILDEPMSGLDPIGRKEVREVIVDLARQGKTIFFSTHILPDVESICDRVGMLLRGRLVREGALQALLDGTVRSVEIRCAELPAPVLEAVGKTALAVRRTPEGHSLVFPGTEQANAAATRLLSAGGRIFSMQPDRESLEETFVRLAAQIEGGPLREAAAG
ncbi:MAG TPA: ABC transporter ATP-binding protein [Anaeromyxobacter sp.]|nr:ABC transporter ATP-binding protein [Anaeromyxobacter sp.]